MSRKNRRMQEHTDAVLMGANRLDDLKRTWELQDRRRKREEAIWITLICLGSIAVVGVFLVGVGVWS